MFCNTRVFMVIESLPRRIEPHVSPERLPEPFSWKNSVVYQIYPDAFIDPKANPTGEKFFNILEHRLPYLQILGIDAIWCNPFHPSSGADGGYDITNYRDIDPKYGTLEEFRAFVEKAHQSGIKIVMDFVGSHTSTDHPWFQKALESKDNPYHDYYLFHSPLPDGSAPNNEQTEWHQPVWQYNKATDEYFLTSFSPKQADLNWRNPKVRQEMGDILRFWMEQGADGFRLDVINFYDKDNSYYQADGVVPVGVEYRRNGPRLFEAVKSIHDTVGDSTLLLGEISVDDGLLYQPTEQMQQYTDIGENVIPESLHEFSERPWNAKEYREFFHLLYSQLPRSAAVGFAFSSHDSAKRTFSTLGIERARQLKVILFLQKGLVVNYYGEEIGMESQVVDPSKRRDEIGRDSQRGPMEWDKVAKEMADPQSHFHLSRKLIGLKHDSIALQEGEDEDILLPGFEDNVFAFKWVSGGETLMVLNNFSDMPLIGLCAGEKDTHATQILTSKMDKEEAIVDLASLSLRPNESIVIKID